MHKRLLYMVGLIVAGEAVFALPFHVARFFRPTVLEVFGLSATELGAAQGVYGIVAMLAYLLGGPLADRFSARKLLAVSLWSTALGGLYLATFPGYKEALVLWGVFGVTTILFFWAALIKATRDWGSDATQGRAYGLLDSGRGALAAGLASIGVIVFGLAFPSGYDAASLAEKEAALRTVIYGYVGVTALTGLFIWFVIPDADPRHDPIASHRQPVFYHLAQAARLPVVWLQALIVVCAYVGYKGFDNYALFAVQAYGVGEVEAAEMVAFASWLRVIAPIGAGLIADRIGASRTLLVCFLLLLCSDLFFGLTEPAVGVTWILFGNILVAATAFFAMRGIYFALMGEAKISPAMTGTVVGLVSLVGFTPDIFVTYVAGVLIDRSPGALGHQHFFLFLAAFAALGALASIAIQRLLPRPSAQVGSASP